MGSKKPRGLTPTERAFLESSTAKTLGSYAEDDPETHFRNMSRGTCSVCGREFAVRSGRLAWHKFPGSVIAHPRIHRPDHCLGFLFPPLEVSREGLERYLGEVLSVLDAMKHDREGYRGSPEWTARQDELREVVLGLARTYQAWEGRAYEIPTWAR